MTLFLPTSVEMILLGLIAVVFVLSGLARAFPQVAWLQAFRFSNRLSEEQKARALRSANVLAGVELIGTGVLVPFVYIAVTLMFFNEFETGTVLIIGASSLLCISLGVWSIVKNR